MTWPLPYNLINNNDLFDINVSFIHFTTSTLVVDSEIKTMRPLFSIDLFRLNIYLIGVR